MIERGMFVVHQIMKLLGNEKQITSIFSTELNDSLKDIEHAIHCVNHTNLARR
jgi:hypothetical protein